MNGFLKLNRGSSTTELLKDKNAFILLTQISLRARRDSAFNPEGLSTGEAMIGDHKCIGLSQREYRTAKKHLEKYGFATFKTTSKGTIAKLIDSRIFDINATENDKPDDKQETS
jgi:hypothetical protein